MTDRQDIPSAFPFVSHGAFADHQFVDPGMTLLDYTAIKLAAAWLSTWPDSAEHPCDAGSKSSEALARVSYKLAEAMMAERVRRMKA